MSKGILFFAAWSIMVVWIVVGAATELSHPYDKALGFGMMFTWMVTLFTAMAYDLVRPLK